MAIQTWTGSGVVGPIDVMGPEEARGKGKAMHRTGTKKAGLGLVWLVSGRPGLGGLGCALLGSRQVSDKWLGPRLVSDT